MEKILTILARIILWFQIHYHSFRCNHNLHSWKTYAIDFQRAISVHPHFQRHVIKVSFQRCIFCSQRRITKEFRTIAKDWQNPERLFKREAVNAESDRH